MKNYFDDVVNRYLIEVNNLNFDAEDINNEILFKKIKKDFKKLELIVFKYENVYREILTNTLFFKEDNKIVNKELSLWGYSKDLYIRTQKKVTTRDIVRDAIKDFNKIRKGKELPYINYDINLYSKIYTSAEEVFEFFENIRNLQKKDIEYKSNMNTLVLKKGLSLVKDYE